jgi:hypothetical protein
MPTHQTGRESDQRPTKTDRRRGENAMIQQAMPEAIDHDGPLVHEWLLALRIVR